MTAAPPSKASAPGAQRNAFGSYGTLSACPPYVHIIKDEGSSVCHNRHISGGGPPRAARLRGSDRLDGSSSNFWTWRLRTSAFRVDLAGLDSCPSARGIPPVDASRAALRLPFPAVLWPSAAGAGDEIGGPSETWKVRVTNVAIAEML